MATDVQQRVGGRLEAVPPRRVTDAGDKVRLAALLAVAIAVHGGIFVRTQVTARDSVGLTRNALQLESPHLAGFGTHVDLIRDRDKDGKQKNNFPHPPGYPLAVLAASHVVRSAWAADLPDQMLRSAQLVSCVAAALLVFPTYWLGRMTFGKPAGFAAALLFQVLPEVARDTSDGLTEGLYLLCVAAALLFGVWGVRKPGIGAFLLCGLATATAYLVRPEGMTVLAAVVGTIAWLAASRAWAWGPAAGRATAAVVGFALLAAPYMFLIGGLTNKPTGNSFPGVKSLQQILSGGGERAKGPAGPAAGPALFAEVYRGPQSGPQWVWAPQAIAKETAKAFHYAPLALAVVGLAWSFGRLKTEPWLVVPILFGAVTLALLLALGNRPRAETGPPPYISGRHTLNLVYAGAIFAAAGIELVAGWLTRVPAVGGVLGRTGWAAVVLGLVVLSCVPGLVRPLHENRSPYRDAGHKLKELLAEIPDSLSTVTVIDPYEWPQFYSGRSQYAVPADPPNSTVTFALLTDKDRAAGKVGPNAVEKPRLDVAWDTANNGAAKVVDGGVFSADDGTTVRIYRLDTPRSAK